MNKRKLKITDTALCDVESIADFIAKDKKNAAVKMLKLIYNSFNILCEHPDIGIKRLDFTQRDVLFFVIKKNYLVIYTVENDKIVILRVLSAYQDICGLL